MQILPYVSEYIKYLCWQFIKYDLVRFGYNDKVFRNPLS